MIRRLRTLEDAMGKLDGKVALISGGAPGQGAAEARRFAEEGARVVFGDIRDAEGKQVEEARVGNMNALRQRSPRPWAPSP